MFFVPVLQTLFLGQLDVFFWLIYRSKRPALWALLSLKPQFLLPALPHIFASKRNLGEFLAALAVLHVPFLIIRPAWPTEWIGFLVGYGQNRFTRVPAATASGAILQSLWIVPFAAAILALVLLRRKNLEHALFLANPALDAIRLLPPDGRHLEDRDPAILAGPLGSLAGAGRLALFGDAPGGHGGGDDQGEGRSRDRG